MELNYGSADFRDTVNSSLGVVGEYRMPVLWGEEHTQISFGDMIERYARFVLDQGREKVTIVDFGACAAVTLCKLSVAGVMYRLISERKAKLIATNLNSVPSADQFYGSFGDPPSLSIKNGEYLEYAVRKKLVDFHAFDAVELKDYLGDEKAQLIIMARMTGFTAPLNDALLRTIGTVLDPEIGTLALGRMPLPGGYKYVPNLLAGVDSLRQFGYEQIPPGDSVLSSNPDSLITDFTLFQAPKAPRFKVLPKRV